MSNVGTPEAYFPSNHISIGYPCFHQPTGAERSVVLIMLAHKHEFHTFRQCGAVNLFPLSIKQKNSSNENNSTLIRSRLLRRSPFQFVGLKTRPRNFDSHVYIDMDDTKPSYHSRKVHCALENGELGLRISVCVCLRFA